MTTNKDNKQTLFDKLYDGAEEAIKTLQKPIAKRTLKRKLTGARDAALSEIDNANLGIQKEVQKVNKCDINTVLRFKSDIRSRQEAIEDIEALYKELFNEDIPKDID